VSAVNAAGRPNRIARTRANRRDPEGSGAEDPAYCEPRLRAASISSPRLIRNPPNAPASAAMTVIA